MPPKKAAGKDSKGKGGDDDTSEKEVRQFLKAYALQAQNHNVEQLPLPFPPVTCEGAGAFARVVIHPQLGGPVFAPLHLKALTDALVASNYCRLLNLSMWNVGLRDEGAAYVASYLNTNRSVVVCDLADCGLGVAGCKALGEMLERNATLTRLSLDNNEIGDRGLEALSASIYVNQALSSLSLPYCGLTPESGEALRTRVFRLQTLSALELRGNALGPSGAIAVLQGLARHPAMTYIGLSDVGFGIEPEVHKALLECVETNLICHSYDLRGNPIGDAHAYTYARAIKGSSTHVISFQTTEMLDPLLFKQLHSICAANKKEWQKKQGKKRKGGKGKGKKKK